MVPFLKFGFEEPAGVGFGAGGNLLGSAAHYQMTAALAAFGTQVDHMVGALDHVHVVLNDDYGVAAANKCVE